VKTEGIGSFHSYRTGSRFFAYAAENGLELTGPDQKPYFNDPNEVPKEELMQEIKFPITKGSIAHRYSISSIIMVADVEGKYGPSIEFKGKMN